MYEHRVPYEHRVLYEHRVPYEHRAPATLQLTEDEVQERVFALEHGFLLPLAQAEAKVTQIEAELEQLDRIHLRSAPLRRAMG